jgi:riboflavin kinase / FMN adenylyltransferase
MGEHKKVRIIGRHILGKGRGKTLGYPTINLSLQGVALEPQMQEGIYAVWVTIRNQKYKGAMHYGAIPTFGEKETSLEVFLLDTLEDELKEIENISITIETVTHIRTIRSFDSQEELIQQITRDVADVRKILSE